MTDQYRLTVQHHWVEEENCDVQKMILLAHYYSGITLMPNHPVNSNINIISNFNSNVNSNCHDSSMAARDPADQHCLAVSPKSPAVSGHCFASSPAFLHSCSGVIMDKKELEALAASQKERIAALEATLATKAAVGQASKPANNSTQDLRQEQLLGQLVQGFMPKVEPTTAVTLADMVKELHGGLDRSSSAGGDVGDVLRRLRGVTCGWTGGLGVAIHARLRPVGDDISAGNLGLVFDNFRDLLVANYKADDDRVHKVLVYGGAPDANHESTRQGYIAEIALCDRPVMSARRLAGHYMYTHGTRLFGANLEVAWKHINDTFNQAPETTLDAYLGAISHLAVAAAAVPVGAIKATCTKCSLTNHNTAEHKSIDELKVFCFVFEILATLNCCYVICMNHARYLMLVILAGFLLCSSLALKQATLAIAKVYTTSVDISHAATHGVSMLCSSLVSIQATYALAFLLIAASFAGYIQRQHKHQILPILSPRCIAFLGDKHYAKKDLVLFDTGCEGISLMDSSCLASRKHQIVEMGTTPARTLVGFASTKTVEVNSYALMKTPWGTIKFHLLEGGKLIGRPIGTIIGTDFLTDRITLSQRFLTLANGVKLPLTKFKGEWPIDLGNPTYSPNPRQRGRPGQLPGQLVPGTLAEGGGGGVGKVAEASSFGQGLAPGPPNRGEGGEADTLGGVEHRGTTLGQGQMAGVGAGTPTNTTRDPPATGSTSWSLAKRSTTLRRRNGTREAGMEKEKETGTRAAGTSEQLNQVNSCSLPPYTSDCSAEQLGCTAEQESQLWEGMEYSMYNHTVGVVEGVLDPTTIEEACTMHVEFYKHAIPPSIHHSKQGQVLLAQARGLCVGCRSFSDAPRVHRERIFSHPGGAEADLFFVTKDEAYFILCDVDSGLIGVHPVANRSRQELEGAICSIILNTFQGVKPSLIRVDGEKGMNFPDEKGPMGIKITQKAKESHAHYIENHIKQAKIMFYTNLKVPPTDLKYITQKYGRHSRAVSAWLSSAFNNKIGVNTGTTPLWRFITGNHKERKAPIHSHQEPNYKVGDLVDILLQRKIQPQGKWSLGWRIIKMNLNAASAEVQKQGENNKYVAFSHMRIFSKAENRDIQDTRLQPPVRQDPVPTMPQVQLDSLLNDDDDEPIIGASAQAQSSPMPRAQSLPSGGAYTSPPIIPMPTNQGWFGQWMMPIAMPTWGNYGYQPNPRTEPSPEITRELNLEPLTPYQNSPQMETQPQWSPLPEIPVIPRDTRHKESAYSPVNTEEYGRGRRQVKQMIVPQELLPRPKPGLVPQVFIPKVREQIVLPPAHMPPAAVEVQAKVQVPKPTAARKTGMEKQLEERMKFLQEKGIPVPTEGRPSRRKSEAEKDIQEVLQTKQVFRRSRSELQKEAQDSPLLLSLGLPPQRVSPNSPTSYKEMEKYIGNPAVYTKLAKALKDEKEDVLAPHKMLSSQQADIVRNKTKKIAKYTWVLRYDPETGKLRARLCFQECWKVREDCSCGSFSKTTWKIVECAYLHKLTQPQTYPNMVKRIIDLTKAFNYSDNTIAQAIWQGEEKFVEVDGKIYHLQLGSYGMKSSPRIFTESLDKTFVSADWKQCDFDPTLWKSKCGKAHAVRCMDDIRIDGPATVVNHLIKTIASEWSIDWTKSSYPKHMEWSKFAGFMTMTNFHKMEMHVKLVNETSLMLPTNCDSRALHTTLGNALWVSNLNPKVMVLVEILTEMRSLLEHKPEEMHKQLQLLVKEYNKWIHLYNTTGKSLLILNPISPTSELMMFSDAGYIASKSKGKVTGLICAIDWMGKPSIISAYSRKTSRVVASPLGAELLSCVEALDALEFVMEVSSFLQVSYRKIGLAVDNYGILSHSGKNHHKVQKGLIHKCYIYLKLRLKEFPQAKIYWIDGPSNPADIGTKSLGSSLQGFQNLTTLCRGIWPNLEIYER